MIDLDKDLAEARDILEARSLMLPELRHLKALQLHHEDSLIAIAMKLSRLHGEVLGIP